MAGVDKNWSGSSLFIESIAITTATIRYFIQWIRLNMRQSGHELEFVIPQAASEFREHLNGADRSLDELQDLAHAGFQCIGDWDGIQQLPVPVDDAIQISRVTHQPSAMPLLA